MHTNESDWTQTRTYGQTCYRLYYPSPQIPPTQIPRARMRPRRIAAGTVAALLIVVMALSPARVQAGGEYAPSPEVREI